MSRHNDPPLPDRIGLCLVHVGKYMSSIFLHITYTYTYANSYAYTYIYIYIYIHITKIHRPASAYTSCKFYCVFACVNYDHTHNLRPCLSFALELFVYSSMSYAELSAIPAALKMKFSPLFPCR